jgi:hypothetical protein
MAAKLFSNPSPTNGKEENFSAFALLAQRKENKSFSQSWYLNSRIQFFE